MTNELRIFFTALMFYTKIPCPAWVDHSEEYLNKATRYFPLIGWIVGGFSALVYFSASFLLPASVSVILSMVASVLITGAFHEDGFADVCDGFGGGWTKEKILLIMKDSRVGAYGVIGLIMILLLKYSLLLDCPPAFLPFILISAHSLSRFAASTFIYTHKYVRENDDSKIKPVAKGISISFLFIAGIFGLFPLLFTAVYFDNYFLLLIMIPVFISKWLLARYFQKWIGGYTGDCLGTTQQVAEVIFYLFSLIILSWKYI
jgi:adenosylcobinamide-GDP ribazoletransferase